MQLSRLDLHVSAPNPHTKPTPTAGKVVVLVDDGLATGVTARAACAAMKASNAAAVMLAVPVGSAHTVDELQQQHVADVVVCLRTPKRFRAVGAHYLVRACLAEAPHCLTRHCCMCFEAIQRVWTSSNAVLVVPAPSSKPSVTCGQLHDQH
jgi:hypothetical protein